MNGRVIAFAADGTSWWTARIVAGLASFHAMTPAGDIGQSRLLAAQKADGTVLITGRSLLDGVAVQIAFAANESGRVDYTLTAAGGKRVEEIHLTDADVAINLV